MKFDRDCKFLNVVEESLSDGGKYFSVNLFVDGAPIKVNIADNAKNSAMIDKLIGLDFGDMVRATFQLVPKDKLYRLALVNC